jgi:hypothetical protein
LRGGADIETYTFANSAPPDQALFRPAAQPAGLSDHPAQCPEMRGASKASAGGPGRRGSQTGCGHCKTTIDRSGGGTASQVTSARLNATIGAGVAVLAVALQVGALGQGFVNWDDNRFVTLNPSILLILGRRRSGDI